MKSKLYQPTVTRVMATTLATQCNNATTMHEACGYIRDFALSLPDASTWRHCGIKLADTLASGKAAFCIFNLQGNSKLPFAAFSTLPGSPSNGGTCPGAGECLEFCYSYRAWRYPSGFYRQLQNTLLLRFNRRIVTDAFNALKQGSTLRLYVDGDFASHDVACYWFTLLMHRADIQCYGYSKSWDILHDCATRGIVPSNYMLNLSSGGKVQSVSVETMKQHAFVRGEFVAVKLARKHAKGFKRYTESDYHADVRESGRVQLNRPVFSCPGTCGTCNKQEHACGSSRFYKVTIAIGVH